MAPRNKTAPATAEELMQRRNELANEVGAIDREVAQLGDEIAKCMSLREPDRDEAARLQSRRNNLLQRREREQAALRSIDDELPVARQRDAERHARAAVERARRSAGDYDKHAGALAEFLDKAAEAAEELRKAGEHHAASLETARDQEIEGDLPRQEVPLPHHAGDSLAQRLQEIGRAIQEAELIRHRRVRGANGKVQARDDKRRDAERRKHEEAEAAQLAERTRGQKRPFEVQQDGSLEPIDLTN